MVFHVLCVFGTNLHPSSSVNLTGPQRKGLHGTSNSIELSILCHNSATFRSWRWTPLGNPLSLSHRLPSRNSSSGGCMIFSLSSMRREFSRVASWVSLLSNGSIIWSIYPPSNNRGSGRRPVRRGKQSSCSTSMFVEWRVSQTRLQLVSNDRPTGPLVPVPSLSLWSLAISQNEGGIVIC